MRVNHTGVICAQALCQGHLERLPSKICAVGWSSSRWPRMKPAMPQQPFERVGATSRHDHPVDVSLISDHDQDGVLDMSIQKSR